MAPSCPNRARPLKYASYDEAGPMIPSDDRLEEEIHSWKSTADSLREPERSLFREMLQLCRQYAPAINSHTSPFATEGLFMAVLFMQFKMIRWLKSEVERLRLNLNDQSQQE